MFTQIVPQLWMLVPKEERDYLAKAFNLPKTGITEIVDQTVVTDGYKAEDLVNITLEKMTAFIGSEETFMRAWELSVMKAHSELNPPTHILTAGIAKLEQVAEKVEEEIKEEVLKVEDKLTKKKGQKNV